MDALNNQIEIDTSTLYNTKNTFTSIKSYTQEPNLNNQPTTNVATSDTQELQVSQKRPAPLSSCPSLPQSPNPLLEKKTSKRYTIDPRQNQKR